MIQTLTYYFNRCPDATELTILTSFDTKNEFLI